MKMLIVVSFLLLSSGVHAVSNTIGAFEDTILNIKRFNWRIAVPDGFAAVSAAESKESHKRGATKVEKSTGVSVEDNSSVIFKFKEGFNQIEAVQQPLILGKRTYSSVKKEVLDLMYQTFTLQLPGCRVDSSSEKELIDGFVFTVINFTAYKGDRKLFTARMYSRMFGNVEFGLNILYDKQDVGDRLLEVFRKSTFHN